MTQPQCCIVEQSLGNVAKTQQTGHEMCKAAMDETNERIQALGTSYDVR
ncbi:MAG: hypothetical protein HC858_03860 [Brachymonas sp.]|nr:hypothetical protein [Brachymonas sp.]